MHTLPSCSEFAMLSQVLSAPQLSDSAIKSPICLTFSRRSASIRYLPVICSAVKAKPSPGLNAKPFRLHIITRERLMENPSMGSAACTISSRIEDQCPGFFSFSRQLEGSALPPWSPCRRLRINSA